MSLATGEGQFHMATIHTHDRRAEIVYDVNGPNRRRRPPLLMIGLPMTANAATTPSASCAAARSTSLCRCPPTRSRAGPSPATRLSMPVERLVEFPCREGRQQGERGVKPQTLAYTVRCDLVRTHVIHTDNVTNDKSVYLQPFSETSEDEACVSAVT